MSSDKAHWAKNSNGRIEFWDGSKWNEDGPEDASLEQFRVLSCKCAPQVRAAWGSEVHAKLGNVCAFCQLPSIDLEDIPLDRKSTRLNSSHSQQSRMPSSA